MGDYTKYTDQELLEQISKGNSQAMELLMKKYRNLVRGEARKYFLAGGDEEDLIQEGMIGLFKAIQNYENDKNTSFATFATLCVKRQIYTTVTASNRKKHGPLNYYISFFSEQGEKREFLEEGSDPEEVVLQKEAILDYQEAIEKRLSKFEKQVMQLYLAGENYIEISRKLNRPSKSIDNAIQRIRKKLG